MERESLAEALKGELVRDKQVKPSKQKIEMMGTVMEALKGTKFRVKRVFK